MSSKYPYESNLINLAKKEFIENGRSKRFIELEDEIINTCFFKDICEFAIVCKACDIKKIQNSIDYKKGQEYPGGYYFLAKFVLGSDHKLLEKHFLQFCKSQNVISVDIVFSAVDFALNFNDANVNELFNVVLRSNLLPYEKCQIAIQMVSKHNNIDVSLFKKFISWCEKQEGDNAFLAYIKKLKDRVDDILESQECGGDINIFPKY